MRWTPTSPNVPYAFTPLVYLATGLIDEGGVNNGVGTDRPFEYAGGYGFDAAAFARTLTARGVPARASNRSTGCRNAASGRARRSPACRSISTIRMRFPTSRTAVEILAAARAQGKLHINNAASFDRDWRARNTVRIPRTRGTVLTRIPSRPHGVRLSAVQRIATDTHWCCRATSRDRS